MIDRLSYGPIASIDIWDCVAYAEHVKYSFAPVGGRRLWTTLGWGWIDRRRCDQLTKTYLRGCGVVCVCLNVRLNGCQSAWLYWPRDEMCGKSDTFRRCCCCFRIQQGPSNKWRPHRIQFICINRATAPG